MSEFAEGTKGDVFRDEEEQNTKEEIESKEEGSSQSEGTQGEDLLEAAAKAAAEAAAEQKRKQDLLSGSNVSPTQHSENGSPVNAAIHTATPYTNTELMSSYGASDFYPEGKCPEDDLADENPDDDAEEFNDPDENGMDVDEAEVDLEEKLAADELPPPLSQMSNMAANLLPDSNVKLEKLQSTRVAVAQFAENNMPNLVNGQPTDLATLQSAIYTLQQQQLIQLQILQQTATAVNARYGPLNVKSAGNDAGYSVPLTTYSRYGKTDSTSGEHCPRFQPIPAVWNSYSPHSANWWHGKQIEIPGRSGSQTTEPRRLERRSVRLPTKTDGETRVTDVASH